MGEMTYERRLRAVGTLIDAEGLRDVALTETAGGVLVTGLAPLDPRVGDLAATPKAFLLTEDRIARAAGPARGRGWPRRG